MEKMSGSPWRARSVLWHLHTVHAPAWEHPALWGPVAASGAQDNLTSPPPVLLSALHFLKNLRSIGGKWLFMGFGHM